MNEEWRQPIGLGIAGVSRLSILLYLRQLTYYARHRFMSNMMGFTDGLILEGMEKRT